MIDLHVLALAPSDGAIAREDGALVLEPEQSLEKASAAERVRQHGPPVPENEARAGLHDGAHVADLHPALRPPAKELDLLGRHVLGPDDGGRAVVLLEVLVDDEAALAELRVMGVRG